MIYDEEFETLPREALEAIQLKRLQDLAERVYATVPFYKKAFDEKGVKPDDVKSLEDLQKLPFTMKQDLRDNYPFGFCAVPRSPAEPSGFSLMSRASATAGSNGWSHGAAVSSSCPTAIRRCSSGRGPSGRSRASPTYRSWRTGSSSGGSAGSAASSCSPSPRSPRPGPSGATASSGPAC